MIAWRPFVLEGKTYDLAHLHPQIITYVQPAKGGQPERKYEVQVIYSLHCFTRGLRPEEDMQEPMAYADSRETRLFDEQRYMCSQQLPALVKALPMATCYHTNHGNFFTIKMLNPGTGQAESYEVYFEASRSSVPGRLNLFVQSAYTRDRAHPNRPKRKKINFFVILYNVLHGRAIKPPPE